MELITLENKDQPYYSNCLLEALKAKIKYGNEIKLIFIPPQFTKPYDIFPHFMWLDTVDNNVYDFHKNGHVKWWQVLYWEGSIRITPKEVFDSWSKENLKKKYLCNI